MQFANCVALAAILYITLTAKYLLLNRKFNFEYMDLTVST